jgi:hypothetical protein
MIGVNVQIIYQPDEASGEPCGGCGEPMEGTRYVMMLQVGEVVQGNITAMSYALCELCYKTLEEDP